jgi:hypothetical protein
MATKNLGSGEDGSWMGEQRRKAILRITPQARSDAVSQTFGVQYLGNLECHGLTVHSRPLTTSSPLSFDLGVSPVDAVAVTLISLALHGIDQIISPQWPLGTIELYLWKLSSHMVKK